MWPVLTVGYANHISMSYGSHNYNWQKSCNLLPPTMMLEKDLFKSYSRPTFYPNKICHIHWLVLILKSICFVKVMRLVLLQSAAAPGQLLSNSATLGVWEAEFKPVLGQDIFGHLGLFMTGWNYFVLWSLVFGESKFPGETDDISLLL